MAKKRKSLENKEMASVEIDLEKNALLNATENKDKIFEKIMCVRPPVTNLIYQMKIILYNFYSVYLLSSLGRLFDTGVH